METSPSFGILGWNPSFQTRTYSVSRLMRKAKSSDRRLPKSSDLGQMNGPLPKSSELAPVYLRADSGPTLGRLWADFGPTLGRLWADFGLTLGQLWADFGLTLGRL